MRMHALGTTCSLYSVIRLPKHQRMYDVLL